MLGHMRVLDHYIRRFLILLTNVVAPADPDITTIEQMDPADFLKNVGTKTYEQNGIVSLFPYRSPLAKTALIELKTHPNRRVADLLGKILFDALAGMAVDMTTDRDTAPVPRDPALRPLVLPTAITRKKRRERGWNQCDLMADGLSQADTEKRFEIRKDILIKTKDTADQVGKDRAERFANVRGTFAVSDPKIVKNRIVVVFDDIVTTGATLDEARRALQDVGAANVILVAFGR
ncbi:MAG TPA: phosphoribosyltransferase family protein [Candidatus Paceibacterota bacterium]|nr:phosphoribosyltransferase family protein [Candidatus Paceibacterota bacterium]